MRPPGSSATVPEATSTACWMREVRFDAGGPAQSMALERAALGRAGEELALAHLTQIHGLVPIATNLRVAVEDLRGELDVVVYDPRSQTLVVCEVKTRTGGAAGGALVALGPRQQVRIRRMTAVLLASGRLRGRRVRFDLVTVDVATPRTGSDARLSHVPDAW
jgi:putative endonuclease